MTVLPHPRRPIDLDRRWKRRTYPANLAAVRRARADVHADLARVPGADEELIAAVVLCASEMFASTVGRVLPGGDGVEVLRTLLLRHGAGGRRVLRLSVTDRWVPGRPSCVPCPAPGAGPGSGSGSGRDEVWREVARGHGLLLIDHFATCWGTRRTGPPGEGHGCVVWAEFELAPRPGPHREAA
ncbi:ATP-binding protein [Nocardiopsis halotolerans]|uniref:hypothetical protein n=1 Tax=Nocardiopsis halotolerans TaxID=124252 RepID=UPI00034A63B8|nr:hypothetical protein [Nocardiopsis halotolerans]